MLMDLFSFAKTPELASDRAGAPTDADLRMAVALLLWAVGVADGRIEKNECAKIADLMERHFGISSEEAAQHRSISLVLHHDQDLEACIELIKKSFSDPQKKLVLRMAVEVAKADNVLATSEETMQAFIAQRLDLAGV